MQAGGAGRIVRIEDFRFVPAEIRVPRGGKVTFVNMDAARHTATSGEKGLFDTGLLEKGESKTVTFEDAGASPYFCRPHPFMRGRVVVR
ncbi:MAG: cupredoxin family copper-binding protein [Actinomycetota bacterium]|nr:cupredoxin family copper-binding protein [Actinomycetota bacterium]